MGMGCGFGVLKKICSGTERREQEGISTCSPDAFLHHGSNLRVTDSLVTTCCFNPTTSIDKAIVMASVARFLNDVVSTGERGGFLVKKVLRIGYRMVLRVF